MASITPALPPPVHSPATSAGAPQHALLARKHGARPHAPSRQASLSAGARPTRAPGLAHSAALKARLALKAPAAQVPRPAPGPVPQPAPGPVPQPAPNPALAGDVDGDGMLTMRDTKALLAYLFHGGEPPAALANADVTGDGSVNIADAIGILSLLQGSGGQASRPTAPPDSAVSLDKIL
ncbi:MAG: dockerin type I domain-containing protein [Planctomycetota bacterium]